MQRVLIVDDEAGIRKLIEAVLMEEGYYVHLASNGYQALEAMEKMTFELVMLDVKLPGLSGIDVLKKIRKQGSDVRVIMMTAYEELNFDKELHEQGVTASIAKPFDITVIRQLVEKAMLT
ncbi:MULTISPECIES: response regulator [Geomicrobium]|uniref:Two-component system response regulator (Stage 0 sporulation protein F) n=1 Tax=Geomicrobium sediminis TaxID=1347788 RepID=A0ABS2P8J9_9BACL|nr:MULTISPECIES: response regulator [Geomicrobium]MBM7631456.1 two-component system response regulator (stage 0 sporulation protein F) [Geomicrobium sediminis]GAK07009.1 sporulation initiation phosphotransferase [Geomicrobium sp. JCM 19038]